MVLRHPDTFTVSYFNIFPKPAKAIRIGKFIPSKYIKNFNVQTQKEGRFTSWVELNQHHVQNAARGYGEWRVAVDAAARIKQEIGFTLLNG